MRIYIIGNDGITLFSDHVAKIDADAEPYPPLLGHLRLAPNTVAGTDIGAPNGRISGAAGIGAILGHDRLHQPGALPVGQVTRRGERLDQILGQHRVAEPQ